MNKRVILSIDVVGYQMEETLRLKVSKKIEVSSFFGQKVLSRFIFFLDENK